MSEKDVKHKAERLVRKHDVVQLSKKEARGWCNATVEVKAKTKGRRIFTGKQEILTYSIKRVRAIIYSTCTVCDTLSSPL